MPTSVRTLARAAGSWLGAAVMTLALLPAPTTSAAVPTPDRDSHRRYLVRDGKLHRAVPRIPAAGHRARPGAVGRGGDRATRLVWSQFRADGSSARIVTARGDGSGFRVLTAHTPGVYDIDPKLSPDGRSVLLERDLPDGTTQIVLMTLQSRRERVLDLGCTEPCAADLTPDWTLDGKRFWFTRVVGPFAEDGSAASAVLWSADLAGRGVRRESPAGLDGIYEEYNARFLPSGEPVVTRYRNQDGRTVLVKAGPRGKETQLTDWALSADIHDTSGAVSGPSKGLVVFESYGGERPPGAASAVVTVPTDCATVVACTARLTFLTSPTQPADGYDESFNPTFSPDGRRIAYVHAWIDKEADAVRGDLWTMTWDGRDKSRFTEVPEFEFRPDWGWAARQAGPGRG